MLGLQFTVIYQFCSYY